ncbi:MAG: hypothetical protein J0652_02500 [Desulfobulbaceae bacterium]|jgi:predicted RNA-binding Zn-ribbon protein involved in translation (DUF1610 family)|nr:hypothetical protein [Desulfobulbaceae bacterium]
MGFDAADMRDAQERRLLAKRRQEEQKTGMKSCAVCKKQISLAAYTCPYCGDPQRKTPEQEKKESDSRAIGWSIIIIIVVIVFSVAKINLGKEKKPYVHRQVDAAAEQRIKDENWKYFTQEEITKRLRDAKSAQFSGVFVSRNSGAPVVCGMVNAKNGFGGYVGFERFIGSGNILGILESDMKAGEMDKAWQEYCE